MTTYENHFGLSRAPFAAHATGTEIFVAPQVAAATTALRKALATSDAIVCLSGPVGSGKTTIAKHTLEKMGEKRRVVTVGRIQLGYDEVLELLLAGLGARQLPKSTVHRFALFRRVLQQLEQQNTRVFIIVEDANGIGFEALTEIEALTAADAGVSGGANVVLLGDQSMRELLRDPKLARVKQRIRGRQALPALTPEELNDYLSHCFRPTGKAFDDIFADGSAECLHRLGGGLPRVVNNLVVAALNAASEQDLQQISPEIIARVAEEEFGLTVEHSVKEIQAAIEQLGSPEEPSEPGANDTPIPELRPEAEAESETSDAEIPDTEVVGAEPEDGLDAWQEPATEEGDNSSTPDLIQDTMPDLEIMPPEPAVEAQADTGETGTQTASGDAETEVELQPEPELELESDSGHQSTQTELPSLSGSLPALEESEAEASQTPGETESEPESEVPAWERDPTLAELRPDLDALERAMAVAQGNDADSEPAQDTEAPAAAGSPGQGSSTDETEGPADAVPEITLDKQIQKKIDEATEALKQTQFDIDTGGLSSDSEASNDEDSASAEDPAAENPDAEAKEELQKIASELAKAKTIEDVDDKLAETLFGEEFSMIAAQVAANAASMGIDTGVASGMEAAAGSEVAADGKSGETEDSSASGRKEVKPPADIQAPALESSASQRLRQVQALNNQSTPLPGPPAASKPPETIVMSEEDTAVPGSPLPKFDDALEDQPQPSAIPTLAVKATPASRDDEDDQDDEDDEEPQKKGFFRRFRRK